MWEDVSKFISENQTSLVTNLIVGLLFFVLGPVLVNLSDRRIKKEKINRAKDSFLDIMENMLVNGETFKKEKIINLYNAVGREHSVNLDRGTDLSSLLEDLSLRFSKSKHLSASQKDEYIDKIGAILHSFESSEYAERSVPRPYRKIFDEIQIDIQQYDNSQLQKNIDELKEKITNSDYSPTAFLIHRIREKMRERPLEFLLFTTFGLVLYIFLIYFLTQGFTTVK